ncbi:MAG: biotin/lipoate A/B protein ligase family protein [Candidatus ainarchaeum sp.]|nr:biotin/lipoate A/B protein ligase family protein [Candidatus ainarchaeum sp.]
MRWRIIDYSENDAYMNMAIDEAISESIVKGAPPTIRFYGWKPSAVSIGYFQSLEHEVDIKHCADLGMDIVRRRTGGGAVYHDHQGEITYSVIGKEDLFPKDIIASYRLICGWIIDSLGLLGIKAEFKPINDIAVGEKKISGNAQTRRGGVLLQHGTILHSVDVDTMFSVLKVSDEKIKDKMIATVKERVTSVSQQKVISRDELYGALLSGFTKGKDFGLGTITDEERNRALELVEKRYLTKEWNAMR